MEQFKLKEDTYYPVGESIIGSLERCLNYGIMPGGFLTACLQSDLKEAFARADHFNSSNMKNIVGYLYNDIPSTAWGSPEAVNAWLEKVTEKAA